MERAEHAAIRIRRIEVSSVYPCRSLRPGQSVFVGNGKQVGIPYVVREFYIGSRDNEIQIG